MTAPPSTRRWALFDAAHLRIEFWCPTSPPPAALAAASDNAGLPVVVMVAPHLGHRTELVCRCQLVGHGAARVDLAQARRLVRTRLADTDLTVLHARFLGDVAPCPCWVLVPGPA